MGCKADLKGAKILNGSSNDDQVDDYRIRYSMFFSFLRLLDIRVRCFFFFNIPLFRGITPLL